MDCADHMWAGFPDDRSDYKERVIPFVAVIGETDSCTIQGSEFIISKGNAVTSLRVDNDIDLTIVIRRVGAV